MQSRFSAIQIHKVLKARHTFTKVVTMNDDSVLLYRVITVYLW